MRVFIDTSAFIAVMNASDQNHSPAKRTWQDLLQKEADLLCNNYVLVEVFALLQNRFGIEAVRLFNDDILPVLDIIWVDKLMHSRAVSAILAAKRRRLSLVDCTSFETMRELGVSCAFTFDSHFVELGFEMIPSTGITP
jgi:predicted nucleic acid-binding protein